MSTCLKLLVMYTCFCASELDMWYQFGNASRLRSHVFRVCGRKSRNLININGELSSGMSLVFGGSLRAGRGNQAERGVVNF